jgi:hypothetical protein
MEVWNGLSSCQADVDAHVEPAGSVVSLDLSASQVQTTQKFDLLL